MIKTIKAPAATLIDDVNNPAIAEKIKLISGKDAPSNPTLIL